MEVYGSYVNLMVTMENQWLLLQITGCYEKSLVAMEVNMEVIRFFEKSLVALELNGCCEK
jgi:hypothetical protein